MQDTNIILLTIYIIGIAYVFNLMVNSIPDNVKYTYNQAEVNKQLKDQNLQDDIGILIVFRPALKLDEPKELSLRITNKSKNLALYADWDNSVILGIGNGRPFRLIRVTPDMSRDLAVQQMPSLILPGNTLKEMVTSENVFKRDESGVYKTSSPIINIPALKTGIKADRKLYKKFMAREVSINFSLQLVIRVSQTAAGIAPGSDKPPLCLVNCPFTIKKLDWTYIMPWNKKRPP